MFQVPSYIDKIQTLADGGNKLSLITQELSPEDMTLLFGLKGKEGWFLFKDTVIEQVDIPEEPVPEFKSDKSPSQRLRAVLWVYWDNNTNKKKPFDTFYREWIDNKINTIKDQID